MANNVICIGKAGGGRGQQLLYQQHFRRGRPLGGDAVFVTGEGKLGTVNTPSSARFKEEIKPINKGKGKPSLRSNLSTLPLQKRVQIPTASRSLGW